MADIPNRKYFSVVRNNNTQTAYPADWPEPETPVNPPSQGGSNFGGNGTKFQLAMFTSPNTVGDSAVSDDGSTVFVDTRELRVNTINNLGTSPTNVLVPDATGVLKLRTLTQFKADLGVITIPLPDGIVTVGGAIQTGNDIEYDTVWVWRISETEYQLPSNDTITYPSAGAGKIRIDLVVGTSSNTIYRVAGTEVNDTETAVAPSVPVGTIALQEVFVNDTGIDDVQDFAVATFVRFDISTQGLSTVQRANARTNIKALSTDTDDSRVGRFVNTGDVDIYSVRPQTTLRIISGGDSSSSVVFSTFRNGSTLSSDRLLYITGSGGLNLVPSSGTGLFMRDSTNSNALTLALNRNGTIIQAKSTDYDESVRRDELYLNYHEFSADAGPLNDFAIDEDTKLLVVGIATELTGVVSGHNNRLLRITASGVTLTVKDEDSSSTASYRFALGSDLTINSNEIYTFIYINSRWRRVQ